MQTLDQNLQQLVREGKVSRQVAQSKAANADSIQ
jgi:Tfp pilus assembly ATPase PilU